MSVNALAIALAPADVSGLPCNLKQYMRRREKRKERREKRERERKGGKRE